LTCKFGLVVCVVMTTYGKFQALF